MKGIVRYSIVLENINSQYIEERIKKNYQYKNVSSFINELISERRRNEGFDNCQNKF